MQKHKVFVYGSLKKGFGNSQLLETAKFICEDTTKESSFNMFSFGGFPGLNRGGAFKISGELYEVDDIDLARLDRLESNGSFYQREQVELDSGDKAWMYITIQEHDYNSTDNEDGIQTWKI